MLIAWRGAHLAVAGAVVVAGLLLTGCGGTVLPNNEEVAGDNPSPTQQPTQPNQDGQPPDTQPSNDDELEPAPIDFSGSYTSAWTANQVRQIVIDETNTMPIVNPPFEKIMPGYWVWDSWPVLLRDGSLAQLNGHYVIISLTAPDDILPGKRHDVATWRYLFSSDGRNWTDGGDVFPEGTALGSRQWAGSTIYDPGSNLVTFFYTAAGQEGETPDGEPPDGQPSASKAVNERLRQAVDEDGEDGDSVIAPPPDADDQNDDQNGDEQNGNGQDNEVIPDRGGGYYYSGQSGDLTYGQRMVQVSATLTDEPQPVSFTDFGEHRIMVEPDLFWYDESEGFAGGFVFAWRDPYYFRDPESGLNFITFTARSANTRFTGWNGVVGLAVADDDDLTSWTLLPPLLDALEVNNELERPHHLYIDGRYYLFFTSGTVERFDPSLSDLDVLAPTALYGFVADEFLGPYLPLNQSGLVLLNPPSAPVQSYSYQVLPGGYVFFFINYFNTGEEGIQEDETGQWHLEHFGGTLAPLLQIEIENNQTRLLGWPKDVFELIDEVEQQPSPPLNGDDDNGTDDDGNNDNGAAPRFLSRAN